jgi:hypothetical protein
MQLADFDLIIGPGEPNRAPSRGREPPEPIGQSLAASLPRLAKICQSQLGEAEDDSDARVSRAKNASDV